MEYTEDQLTEWFDFEKHKPTEVGVYEVQNTHCQWTNYSYWDGRKFKYLTSKESLPDDAFNKRDWCTGADIKGWRGLSCDPSAPKKRAGNKKVTRWMHITGMIGSDLIHKVHGVYKTKPEAENARDKRNSKGWRSSIRHIRFRTPEA